MQLGLTLDIARKYYSPQDIMRWIDMLAEYGYSFLQLHISDEENYGIESALLNQTENNAYCRDGIWYNVETGKPFLNSEQIGNIISRAASRHIEIIPEIDSPAHMGGIWKLLGQADKEESGGYSVIELRVALSNELNMSFPSAIGFMTALYSEVITMFGGAGSLKHFHIGCDEFGGAESTEYSEHVFVPYVNRMIKWLNRRGITARLWNDGFCRDSFTRICGEFEVTYWTAGEHGRCTMEELTDAGIRVFNYNRYYLYFLPGKNGHDVSVLEADMRKAASDIRDFWNPGLWDADHLNSRISVNDRIMGSSIALWGEFASQVESKDIVERSRCMIEALSRCKS